MKSTSSSILRFFILFLLHLFSVFLFSSFAISAQIRLVWDPNTEPDLAGYKIYYGTTPGTYGTYIDVGDVTEHTMTGLTSGQVYYVTVTAYNQPSNNESDYSNEVSGEAREPTQVFTVTTDPPGLLIEVDGVALSSRKRFGWDVGSLPSVSGY